MHSLHVCSKSTGMEYQCNLLVKTVEAKTIIPYSDYPRFAGLCKVGCKNYAGKWSCPPYSPSFTDFYQNETYLCLFVLYMNMDQFGHIKNSYTRLKAANVMMKSRIDQFLRSKAGEGRMISTGSCRLCKACRAKVNEPCAHPERMAYSFEALGINVGAMTQDLCGHSLLWYSKGMVPLYTTVVAGLLANEPPDPAGLVSQLQMVASQ